MSFSEVEHFSTILSGCESINAGGELTPNGHYASSVLKLHAQDEGLVAGQEGFTDAVKKGAKKTGEFVKKLFEAIKKWFADTFTSTKTKFKSIFDKAPTEEDKAKVVAKIEGPIATQIKAVKAASEKAPDGVDLKGLIAACDKVLSTLEGKPAAGALISAVNTLLDQINASSKKFIAYIGSLVPKTHQDLHAPYDKSVQEYKAWAEPVNRLTKTITDAAASQVK
jgi:hypothetical protein